jgi:hypothetical protein
MEFPAHPARKSGKIKSATRILHTIQQPGDQDNCPHRQNRYRPPVRMSLKRNLFHTKIPVYQGNNREFFGSDGLSAELQASKELTLQGFRL